MSATVFSPFATATQAGFAVRRSYLTDIFVAEDGTEGRGWLRKIPEQEVSYLARTLEGYRTGWLDALTYGNQATQLAVPLWPLGTYLASAVTAGSNRTLTVDATADRFVNGGYAVLWNSEGRSEEVLIEGLTGTTITADVTLDWGAGTFVIPSVRGAFTGDLPTSRLSASIAEVPVTFTLALGTDPGVTAVESAAVFTVAPYMRVDVAHGYALMRDRIDNRTYTYQDFSRRATPIGSRPLKVWLNSRSAVTALVAWFDGLRGRCKTFWLPTYQADFTVTAGLGTTTLTITRSGYTTHLFPNMSRRHLAAIQADGTVTHCTVIAAVDNGVAAGTETLTVDVAPPVSTTLLSYLLYGRLDSDTLEVRWRHNSFAHCDLGFVECPGELEPTVALVDEDGNVIEEPPSPPNPAAGPAVASMSTARVPAGREDVATIGTIYLRDANGLLASSAPDAVAAAVTGANTATPTLTTLSTNTRQFRYVPGDQGSDILDITYGGVPIGGSPYTSVVGATAATVSIPFGLSRQPAARYSLSPDTGTVSSSIRPANILGILDDAAAAGVKVCIVIPRGDVKDAAGRLSLTRFEAAVDALAAVSGVDAHITGGTFAMHEVIDEPGPLHWGGQAVPGTTLAAACAYSKSVWPDVKTAIRFPPYLLPPMDTSALDYAWAQYTHVAGDVSAFRARNERSARLIGVELVCGLNLINGGDGSSGIAGSESGQWSMTSAEILAYGQVMAASPLCHWFNCWWYHEARLSYLTGVQSALADLAAFVAGQVRV